MTPHPRLPYLLEQYFHKRCSPSEREELLLLVHNEAHEQEIKEWMAASAQHIEMRELNQDASERIFTAASGATTTPSLGKAGIRKMYRAITIGAAACLLTAGMAYWLFVTKPSAKQEDNSLVAAQKIAPGKNGAVLTLADGRQVVLEEAANGTVASQGNTTVTKNNGLISYNTSGNTGGEMLYNTLRTQRGNQFTLVLPDGTKVWLNAASSITYPTHFSGKDRTVKVTGEAYFEVVHNSSQPFKVETDGQLIEDIGTSFNVNSYKEEGVIKTTLIQGAVKVTETVSKQSAVIHPGQQVMSFASGEKMQTNSDLDVNDEVAWKDGLFVFKDASIESIMRQAARWYDIEVRYEGRMPSKQFGGKMSKNVPLSGFLEVFKYAGINFSISGRTITVSS